MKKTILLLLFSCAFMIHSFAQTKKIALESHSGKRASLKVDGDGNFGEYRPNPIDEAVMHHYADSVRKSDSMKNVAAMTQRKADSIHQADSIENAKRATAPKPKQKKKAKGLHAASDFRKPNHSAVVSSR